MRFDSKKRTRRSRASRLALALGVSFAFAGLTAIMAAGCGQENGVVGGVCAPMLTECSLSCFDLQIDNDNCGACGNVCPPTKQCAGGVCGGPSLDATADGKGDGNGEFDGNDLDGSNQFCDVQDKTHCHPDGAPFDGDDDSDGGPLDVNPGDVTYPDGCVPPFNTPSNCGTCGNVCTSPNPACGLVDGSYACVPTCFAPLTDCNNRCVNLLRDPANCGACNNVCASNYCLLATCQGTVAGNIMVIGHDFLTTGVNEQQAKLLTNSVFYNNTSAVKVLSFEEFATPAVVTNVRSILSSYATSHNVTLTYTGTNNETDVPGGKLKTNVDVLLVIDQAGAPAGKMGALGSAWAPAMSQFAQGGGIVIVLDGAQGTAKEMPAFETNGALLTVTGHTALAAGKPVSITAPGTIARGMTSVYLVDDNSVSFTTSEPSSPKLFYVATDAPPSNDLVAVHKIVN